MPSRGLAVELRRGPDGLPVLLWRLDPPRLAIASAPHGGGLAPRGWVLNAQVRSDYDGTDPDAHLRRLAASLGLDDGEGVGFLTAADVTRYQEADADGVAAFATVGLRHPTWAADVDGATNETSSPGAGTINLVVAVPARLAEAALVNAVITATEAKSQALAALAVAGTGTATDAVCVLCPTDGPADPFAGPRSRVGARIARAVHDAVRNGTLLWQEMPS
jgi:adenosylcobinamide hydrolase